MSKNPGESSLAQRVSLGEGRRPRIIVLPSPQPLREEGAQGWLWVCVTPSDAHRDQVAEKTKGYRRIWNTSTENYGSSYTSKTQGSLQVSFASCLMETWVPVSLRKTAVECDEKLQIRSWGNSRVGRGLWSTRKGCPSGRRSCCWAADNACLLLNAVPVLTALSFFQEKPEIALDIYGKSFPFTYYDLT